MYVRVRPCVHIFTCFFFLLKVKNKFKFKKIYYKKKIQKHPRQFLPSQGCQNTSHSGRATSAFLPVLFPLAGTVAPALPQLRWPHWIRPGLHEPSGGHRAGAGHTAEE